MINFNNSNANMIFYKKRNAKKNIKSLVNNISSNKTLKIQNNKTYPAPSQVQTRKYGIPASKKLVESFKPYKSITIDGVTIKKNFIELYRTKSKYYDLKKTNPSSNITWENYLRNELNGTLEEFKTYLKNKGLNYSELSASQRTSMINSIEFKSHSNKGRFTNGTYCGKGSGSYLQRTSRKGIIKTAAKNVKI